MQIGIDLPAQLRRYRSGEVCTRSTAIAELIQNAQRAGATRLDFVCEPGHLTVSDDGTGCADAADYFTIARSGWGRKVVEEERPFGQGGLLSLLVLASHIHVRSGFGTADWDIDRTLTDGDLSVQIDPQNTEPGFHLRLTLLDDVTAEELRTAVLTEGGAVDLQISWNRQQTARVKPFEVGDHRISGDGFRGALTIGGEGSCPVLYHRGRIVRPLREIPYFTGAIEADRITLRLPDRKDVVENSRWRTFLKSVRGSVKRIIAGRFQDDPVVLQRMGHVFAAYLDVDELVDHLNWKYVGEEKTDDDAPSRFVTPIEELMATADPVVVEQAAAALVSMEKVLSAPAAHAPDEAPVDATAPHADEAPAPGSAVPQDAKKTLIAAFWVDSWEQGFKRELLDEARYYQLPVVIVTDDLRRRAVTKRGLPHISRLRDYITFEDTIKARAPKQDVEFRALTKRVFGRELSLQYGTIKRTMRCALPGKVFRRNIAVDAMACPAQNAIVLQRAAMWPRAERGSLSAASLRQLVLNNLNAIAHETAHLVFGTKDGSLNHFRLESLISAAYAAGIMHKDT